MSSPVKVYTRLVNMKTELVPASSQDRSKPLVSPKSTLVKQNTVVENSVKDKVVVRCASPGVPVLTMASRHAAFRPVVPPSADFIRKKRKWLSLASKLEMIDMVESGQGCVEIAKKLGLHESTIRRIYRTRHEIRQCARESGEANNKMDGVCRPLLEKMEKTLNRCIIEQKKGKVDTIAIKTEVRSEHDDLPPPPPPLQEPNTGGSEAFHDNSGRLNVHSSAGADEEENLSPTLASSPPFHNSSDLPLPCSHTSPSVLPCRASSSQPRPHPVPECCLKPQGKDVASLHTGCCHRSQELHHIQMRVEEAKLVTEESRVATEKAKTEAFLAMSTFFKNLDKSFTSTNNDATSVARVLSDDKGMFASIGLAHKLLDADHQDQ